MKLVKEEQKVHQSRTQQHTGGIQQYYEAVKERVKERLVRLQSCPPSVRQYFCPLTFRGQASLCTSGKNALNEKARQRDTFTAKMAIRKLISTYVQRYR